MNVASFTGMNTIISNFGMEIKLIKRGKKTSNPTKPNSSYQSKLLNIFGPPVVPALNVVDKTFRHINKLCPKLWLLILGFIYNKYKAKMLRERRN